MAIFLARSASRSSILRNPGHNPAAMPISPGLCEKRMKVATSRTCLILGGKSQNPIPLIDSRIWFSVLRHLSLGVMRIDFYPIHITNANSCTKITVPESVGTLVDFYEMSNWKFQELQPILEFYPLHLGWRKHFRWRILNFCYVLVHHFQVGPPQCSQITLLTLLWFFSQQKWHKRLMRIFNE